MFKRLTNKKVFEEIRALNLGFKTTIAKQRILNLIKNKYEEVGVRESDENEASIRAIITRVCGTLHEYWVKTNYSIGFFLNKYENWVSKEIILPTSEFFWSL